MYVKSPHRPGVHQEGKDKSRDTARTKLPIRMVANHWAIVESKETLLVRACNQPNFLVPPFEFELIRIAA